MPPKRLSVGVDVGRAERDRATERKRVQRVAQAAAAAENVGDSIDGVSEDERGAKMGGGGAAGASSSSGAKSGPRAACS
jgi:hypothetical protein